MFKRWNSIVDLSSNAGQSLFSILFKLFEYAIQLESNRERRIDPQLRTIASLFQQSTSRLHSHGHVADSVTVAPAPGGSPASRRQHQLRVELIFPFGHVKSICGFVFSPFAYPMVRVVQEFLGILGFAAKTIGCTARPHFAGVGTTQETAKDLVIVVFG